jgi:exodeoxyribonuclease V beta subunit
MTVRSFDCLADGVLDGRKLIESSAGTGKTWTIASLYLRLVVERELQVGQILVVTFTTAATEELNGRIRRKLRDASVAFSGGAVDDAFILALRDRLAAAGRLSAAAELASNALRMFDEAAIFTIHGFCGRVLKDNAFESASLFDTELVPDQGDLVDEVAADFYRSRIHGTITPWPMRYVDPLAHFEANGLNPADLARFIRDHAGKPYLSILPSIDDSLATCRGIPALEAAFETARAAAVAAWQAGRDAIPSLLRDGRLNGNSYSAKIVARMAEEMDRLSCEPPRLVEFTDLLRFRPEKLEARRNKGKTAPEHPFFERFEAWHLASEALRSAYFAPVMAMRHELAAYAESELERRKRKGNVRFYDDLLLDLRKALDGPSRRALEERVRGRYAAALIDEFQDTDLLQYGIFDAFFPAGSMLFLIGDPKQAIYSFRGADIFAYLEAAANVESRYSLGENFRSAPALVEAVNVLFRSAPDPFVFPQIDYPEVSAAAQATPKESCRDGVPDPAPLRFRILPRPAGAKPGHAIGKGEATREAVADTASQVVRLLEEGRAGVETIDGRGVLPGDVAVLVRTNRQAFDIHAALRRAGVPAVIYGSESVFGSREAESLRRVLAAIVEPGHDGRVRAALATAWFGVDAGTLFRLQDDEEGWTGWMLRFLGWREMWASDGFVAMGRDMIREAGIRTRLLGLPDGERRLTDLLHLFELMHEVEHEEGLGVEALCAWLSRRIADAASDEATRRPSSEEHQLRLETDEMAVKVVTVHKSKGLEYPIVFCPFLWHAHDPAGMGKGVAERGVLCHDPVDGSRTIRDFGSPAIDVHAAQASSESRSENARMLYVALTRAKFRCVATWGAIKGAGETALARLLHPAGIPDHDDGLLDDLRALAARSGRIAVETVGAPAFSRLPVAEASASSLECRTFRGRIDRDWGVTSFTGLVAGAGGKGEKPDRDALALAPPPADDGAARPEGGIPTPFDFPRGAKAGLFFHSLMETIDFAAGDEAIRDAVRAGLPAFGFGAEWEGLAAAMVRNALSTALDAKDPAFTLKSLPRSRRLHEIEFGLPLERLTPSAISEAYAECRGKHDVDPGAVARLSFPTVRGLLKGYIDLVFERGGRYFLLDWKTNHLGGRIEDYAPESLARSMTDSFYFLQSHLYAVALDRYLSRRIAGYSHDAHFGGVFYLYVRGLDPARGAAFGVYGDRPAKALVEALSRRIGGLT